MFKHDRRPEKRSDVCRFLVIHSAILCFAVFGTTILWAQSPTPSPTPETDVMLGGYHVTSTTEFGWRWRSLDGNENKYRSDLNYKQGFRTFDTNLLLESESGKGKYFDSLLISNSGWGADPTGFTRVNMEKIGIYKFNANVRRITYFNNLSNHALGEHTQNTVHNFGDFDLTVLPQNEKFKINLGASFSKSTGPGVFTARAFSDEFAVETNTRNRSDDFRIGIEGKLLGFDYGLTQGFRTFNDRSSYELAAPSLGNNTTNNARLATFSRSYPTEGHAYYTQFNAHRTFAKKLDVTIRLIYSSTNSRFSMLELITGRDNSNNFVDLDRFQIGGDAKRPQTRGDLGVTYMATNKFRISNTFSFDKFAVNGGEAFEEQLFRRNAAGNPLATTLTRSAGYRVNDYLRYVNTLEGDYQFNNAVSFHIGYRYTHRKVDVTGFDRTLTSPPSGTNPTIINEEESNSTNTFLAGMKIKPVKNWVIFWDAERGTADNVFTRVENYHFTNFRARSRLTFNKVAFNASVITKNNENPSQPTDIQPLAYDTIVKNRFYSGTVEWAPISELTISSGYTYHHLTSTTPIVLPVGGVYLLGFSQFYMRDSYAYFDVTAKPHKRVSLYASYRISKDKGQGDRFSAIIQNIITSYPMQFTTPEFRAAFRISRNVDWNVGYQYYDYKDVQTPGQNYRAHLPFTSLRIYFGARAGDR